MKKYVFITMNIGGINGAEQYIYNKMNFLKDQGYQVLIFSGRPEKILIEGFYPYKDLIHPGLRFYPYCLKKKETETVLSWMLSAINIQPGDDCIVESSNVISALWGELLCSRLGCKHLAIIMQEKNNYQADMRAFLQFKYDRHELSGIMDHSVSNMLGDLNLPLRPDARVRAFCTNVVQDCADPYSPFFDPHADITFGSIGRLEKDYVLPLINSLVGFFRDHADTRYNLVLIGGCADKHRLQTIKDTLATCNNVHLVLTGNLYPIPRTLVEKVDIFVSAAGSASATYYQQRPTVKVNHLTAEPLGIMGHDILVGESNATAPNPPRTSRTLVDYIQDILTSSVDIRYIQNWDDSFNESMRTEFERHLHFGDEASERTYYDVFQVRYHDLKYKLCRVVCKIIGVTTAYKILEFIRKLVRG